ncbi:motility associated factor glycosyltransferase family protein [Brevibacillus fulvus]|uniref:6-hydroxymethylpterin diphosphokinase MptE-like domain-containing protein n=1 Tax=Brevibacillus fulvus TaxID=1125967 RepID=A0A939BTH1_9BACL|nr:6-hydroxymethylpterin diphosphokinase MptE-like protein [Brevibacillus fulvus]MBM7591498.1 hypothetical protein [Brevibacillus fulvus]
MSPPKHIIQQDVIKGQAPSVFPEQAKNGLWTATVREADLPPFYLHSRYDPLKEARQFMMPHLENIRQEQPDMVVVYGAGCGYHLDVLLESIAELTVPIEVWETNVPMFLQHGKMAMYEKALRSERVAFVVTEHLAVFAERVEKWPEQNVYVIVHQPSLRAMPKHLEALKQALQDYAISQNSAVAFTKLLAHNFAQNTAVDWPSISAFRDLRVPAVLVSAGPSLKKALPYLNELKKHSLVGSVGTAAALLWQNGIIPDFVVMSDPKPGMMHQLQGWESEQVPLFFLSTLYAELVAQYKGPKFIVFQEGYAPAEERAAQRQEPTIQTGGSVATTLFSLVRSFGCQPICLVGQDLAYTDNQTHAEGTPAFAQWTGEARGQRVKSFDGAGTVLAPRNLLAYKKWFERQAAESEETFYNATEGGAFIEGFEHLSLPAFLQKVSSTEVTEVRAEFNRLVHNATQGSF